MEWLPKPGVFYSFMAVLCLSAIIAGIFGTDFENRHQNQLKSHYLSIKLEEDKTWDSADYYLNLAILNKESIGEKGDSSFPAFKKYQLFHKRWDVLRDSSFALFQKMYK